MLPIEVLRDMFEYRDGKLLWRRSPGPKRAAGTEAGSVGDRGYRNVCVRGTMLLAHRIIFAIHHGYWPDSVDHINGIKDDNRIENLRACTREQNQANRGCPKHSTSGFKGVHSKKHGRWQAKIVVRGVSHHLGTFDTPEAASAAYQAAANDLQGEFAWTRRTDAVVKIPHHGEIS